MPEVPRAQVSGNHDGFEAVVFDFGGVLITSISNQLSTIAASHGVDTAVMHEVILGPRDSGPEHPWHRAERGEIAVAAIQELLDPWAAEHGVTLHGDEMDRILAPGGYTVVDAMIERVTRLRSEGYRTGLLTNTFAEFRPTMESDIDFDLFDVVVESFAVGSRKPERAIYEITQSGLGVDHGAIVYLDDFEQNLIEPLTLGWTTIQVGDHSDALTRLDELLEGHTPRPA
jgi:epoxide hydrolase-like predicted phosphatase